VNKLTVIECELCNSTGGLLPWQDDFRRVALIDDDDNSGICRVILNRHTKEMTDLSATERAATPGPKPDPDALALCLQQHI
jgi:hypothetical protein